MKPKQILLSILPFLMSMISIDSFAYDIKVANSYGVTIYYEWVNNETELAVTSGPYDYNGSVVIPATVTYNGNTYSVTRIGRLAFSYCSGLTSVTIPNSVTSIGNDAFKYSSGLTSVTIPNSVTSIGNSAFKGCSGLTTVTIPNSVTFIDDGAFAGSGLTSVTIPKSLKTISYDTFYYCSDLTSVTIPESVTSIGDDAFTNCFNLTKVIVEDIAAWCNINFGAEGGDNNPLYYAHHLYSDENTEITDLVIPNSVTSISSYAFRGCYGLTSVTIGDNVTSIGSSAFDDCSSLTSVTIGDNVTSIGNSAFNDCSSLTSVNIPGSVTNIGARAFYNCKNLTKVIVNDITAWCNINFDNGNSVLFYGPNPLYYAHHLYSDENTEITDLVIPNSVTSISSYAFRGCYGLTSVTIPDNVTSIDFYAFAGCRGLTSVTIPNSVTSIGSSAFAGCSGLTSVTIPESVTSIGDDAFYNCPSLTSVTVDIKTPLTIASSTFSNRANATLYVPVGCKAAYEAADYWKEFGVIVEMAAPSPAITFADTNVKTLCVQNWDTNGDGELSEAEAATVTDLGTVFQYNTEITSFDELQYFTGLTSIRDYAFYDCSGLTSITIPNTVTTIGTRAFGGCEKLSILTIPSSVKTIGVDAFRNCTGIESLTISDGVESIRSGAFAGLEKIVSLHIPQSVISIDDYSSLYNGVSYGQPFYYCKSLESITVDADNPNFDTRNGSNIIYEKSTNKLIAGCKNSSIPNGTLIIGNAAFYGVPFESITLPSGITTIGRVAFSNCENLKSITIPAGVTKIDSWAFSNCPKLESVTLLTGLKEIGEGAFTTNSNYLKTIVIPEGVTTIGADAFRDCYALESVSLPSTLISGMSGTFSGCNNLTVVYAYMESPNYIYNQNTFTNSSPATLYVPANSQEAYMNAQYWQDFNIVVMEAPSPTITFADTNVKALCVQNWDTNGDGELSEAEAAAVTSLGVVFKGNTEITSFNELQYFTGLTEIADNAFADCTSLTSVSLPSTVNKIQEWAFSNTAFTTFAIPDFIEEVAAHSFYGCKQLTSLYVGTGLSTIGWKAFATCPVLSQIVVSENNIYFDSRNESNCIIETGTNTLIVGCKNTIIPSTVTNIATVAFEGCWNLTEITLPNSLVEIGELAFSWCYSLASITIPASVTSIGSNAFENCGSLNSVTVENESPVAIDENTFSNRANATLYVPYGSKAVYETAEYWKDFNIVSWHNIIVNSNMEGDDITCFFSKEDAGDPQPSIIVDGAGKDGSCGIVLNSADNPVNSWDTQFFVRLPMSLPAGTNYRVKFNYKASRNAEASTQMHTEPGNYIFWEGIGNLNFTTEWQTYEYMGVISSEQSPEDNMQTIAFNLSESNSATTYYFDNFVFEIDEDHITPVATVKTAPIGKILNYTGEAQELINAGTTDDGTMVYQLNWGGFSEAIPTASEVGVYTIDYKVIGSDGYLDSKTYTITAGILSSQMADLIVNGDMEGTDNVCFFSRENRLENDEIVPSTIVEGAGVDGSRGIVVQSIDNPSETWDTQFFLRLPQTLPAGTNYYISFDYKASQEASGFTGTHAEPSQYLWNGIGTINFTADWKHFELIGTVSAEQSPADNPMRTIAFDLAVTPTSATYYFDNVVFEIDRNQTTPLAIVAEAPTPKDLTYTGEAQELIKPGRAIFGTMHYSLDGTNFSTSIPTGTDVGEYTVFYKVVGDEDHGDTEAATVIVTLAQPVNLLYADNVSVCRGSRVVLPISLKNDDAVNMLDFYLQLPDGMSIADGSDGNPDVSLVSGRSNKHVVTAQLKEVGRYHIVCYSSQNNAFNDNDGALFNITLACDEDVAVGSYEGTVMSILMSDTDRNSLAQPNFTFNIEVPDLQLGDVNNDRNINGLDIVEMVDHIMHRPSENFHFATADLHCDNKINGLDLVKLVKLVLDQDITQNASHAPAMRRNAPKEGWLTLKDNGRGSLTMGIDSSDGFILAQCVVEVSEGMQLKDITADGNHLVAWQPIDEHRYAVVAYSVRNDVFGTNKTLLAINYTGKGNISISNTMLVDSGRNERHFAPAGLDVVTGLEAVGMEGSADTYDLQGRKMTDGNLPKGVYIVNGKKVIVR